MRESCRILLILGLGSSLLPVGHHCYRICQSPPEFMFWKLFTPSIVQKPNASSSPQKDSKRSKEIGFPFESIWINTDKPAGRIKVLRDVLQLFHCKHSNATSYFQGLHGWAKVKSHTTWVVIKQQEPLKSYLCCTCATTSSSDSGSCIFENSKMFLVLLIPFLKCWREVYLLNFFWMEDVKNRIPSARNIWLPDFQVI